MTQCLVTLVDRMETAKTRKGRFILEAAAGAVLSAMTPVYALKNDNVVRLVSDKGDAS
ncbi:hypothetical protein AncyloWKF20_07565 [Ancylobacter sp. WKF20]|uniref:hypothetical protein n=1 Tax=Ancylobacter sp. WKF20 TaxID=3039801 RepID=UPI00243457F9|nr:hypothetical protein [Ancylobacter sp. WKF20]WGD31667.1 hypothetical protein AncyloWKF20_07565 [Ancylobacter sp. WKF20]